MTNTLYLVFYFALRHSCGKKMENRLNHHVSFQCIGIIVMVDIIVISAFVIVIVEITFIASPSGNQPDWHLRVPRSLPLSFLLLFLIFLLLLPLLLLLLKTPLLPLLPAIIQIGTCVCQDRCLYHSCCLSMMTSCVLTALREDVPS